MEEKNTIINGNKGNYIDFYNNFNGGYEQILQYYKESYENEYINKNILIYESTQYLVDKPLLNLYFLKPNKELQKKLKGFKYNYELNDLEYMYYDEFFMEDEASDNFPEGWRFLTNYLDEDIYDNNEFWYQYDFLEAVNINDKKQIMNNEYLKDTSLKIIFSEDKEDLEYEESSFEDILLDRFDELIESFCSNNPLCEDGQLSYLIEKCIYR